MSESIIKRIAALLNMAKDSSSPHEAAIAAQRARALMDKHQISTADIEEATPAQIRWELVGQAYRFMPKWKDILSVAVARYNDCVAEAVNLNGTNKKQITYAGFDEDITLALLMFDYLVNEVTRHCSDYQRDHGYSRYNARVGDAFKLGAVNEICSRMYHQLDERKVAMVSEGGTNLVVSKQNTIQLALGREVKYTTTKQKDRKEYDEKKALYHGRVAGGTIPLAQIIEDKSGE